MHQTGIRHRSNSLCKEKFQLSKQWRSAVSWCRQCIQQTQQKSQSRKPEKTVCPCTLTYTTATTLPPRYIWKMGPHTVTVGVTPGDNAAHAISRCNLSVGVALIVWFTTNGMCVKNNTIILYMQHKQAIVREIATHDLYCCLPAAVQSFAHMPLGISDRNKMVLWPGCGGRAKFSLHTKNMQLVWFVVKRRGWCCNLSVGVDCVIHHERDVHEK